jgi:hypothetical protein
MTASNADRSLSLARTAHGIGLAAVLALGLTSGAHAQAGAWGTPWPKAPSVVVLAQGNDGRAALVRDAVAFWNRTFAELGSALRLGPVTQVSSAIPATELAALSQQVLSRSGVPAMPVAVQQAGGNIVVALSDGGFVSFAARWPQQQKALVGVRSDKHFPLTLPNVARNVIAHELGHAIGLAHNSDPSMLMCGRPASCRPDLFQSPTAHYFPLASAEKARLKAMYP